MTNNPANKKPNVLTSKQKKSLSQFRKFDLSDIDRNHHKLSAVDIANLEQVQWYTFNLNNEDLNKIKSLQLKLPLIIKAQQEKVLNTQSKHSKVAVPTLKVITEDDSRELRDNPEFA